MHAMRAFILAMILALPRAGASELDHQRRLCHGMRLEMTLANGARADCLSDTHAIEVEFSEKWAEGLGQALLYSASTDLSPAIFLICRDTPKNCLAHRLRLDEAITAWRLPVEVWPVDRRRND